MNEQQWERKLGISTTASDYEKDDNHHSRYEATAYSVLERIAQSGLIGPDDVLADYGCGKGRVGFCLNHLLGCSVVGIEYNGDLVRCAEKNLSSYKGKFLQKIRFINVSAEHHRVDRENCFYFFNPFSAAILQTVLNRIFDSYYSDPRRMRLFFYYALDSYLELLMTDERLAYLTEIDCRDLFPGDHPREKVLVFEVNG